LPVPEAAFTNALRGGVDGERTLRGLLRNVRLGETLSADVLALAAQRAGFNLVDRLRRARDGARRRGVLEPPRWTAERAGLASG